MTMIDPTFVITVLPVTTITGTGVTASNAFAHAYTLADRRGIDGATSAAQPLVVRSMTPRLRAQGDGE